MSTNEMVVWIIIVVAIASMYVTYKFFEYKKVKVEAENGIIRDRWGDPVDTEIKEEDL